ncbi:hypothetical protein BJ170DRAFT_683266 [Xylariales sp. AK1849]|nr:hypothetical protein BJ170DRAFT_683266 [Xylariales sp. AK1849]
MSSIAKTVVATGASSGLGFEAVKQLLEQTQPYKFILGARDIRRTQAAFDALKFDARKHSVSVLPLELSDLRGVKTFAQQTLDKLGQDKLDFLFLNAGMSNSAIGPGPHGSKWCDSHVVNHLSQHYLIHSLRDVLVASKSRIVVVSSGAIRNVRDNDPKTLDTDLKAESGTGAMVVYSASKFAQLLGAHYWRRQLEDSCKVVAVSPGLIAGTGLGRQTGMKLTLDMPDAKTIEEGESALMPFSRWYTRSAQNLLRAFTRDDFPVDPEQIFLTSWGEWWHKDIYATSLDQELQNKWCLSKEDIEKEEGISA